MIDRARRMKPVVPPRMLHDIFTPEENRRLFHILRTNGPWRLIAAIYFKSVEELLAISSPGAGGTRPRSLSDMLNPSFRGFFGNHGLPYEEEAHEIFYSRKLVDLVKSMHGARYGTPYLFQFNIQGPCHGYDPGHFDGRSWRGLDPTNMPAWLGAVMAKSGLFDAWEVKAGQVISYYYPSDVDGGFTYWPDGPEAAPQRMAAPFWNSGLLTDNQHMYHRGEACGPRDRRDTPDGMTLDSVLEADGEQGWRVVDGDRLIARYQPSDMRILFHYSAHVFTDMDELKLFYDHKDDLTIERAFDMLIADLKRRGVGFAMPGDPMTDRAFIATLTETYAMSPSHYPAEAPLDVRPAIAA
ncbi:hypothetical protein J3E64_001976 [Sphingobium sp. OAS761]|uniref:hypothetical protein n=1 Tax=Sphingobium sp. OAS761 TaxID=2817901 RepID=UPI0020A231E2|nr:hypothetical protein [Sphingobium sp. OAS761]MCP1470288.1 hypothetical protein [Sphingobium sp. OAS761]